MRMGKRKFVVGLACLGMGIMAYHSGVLPDSWRDKLPDLPAVGDIARHLGSNADGTGSGEVEIVNIPATGEPVRCITLNAHDYFVRAEQAEGESKTKSPTEREAVADVIVGRRADIVGLCEIGDEAALNDLMSRLARKGHPFPHHVILNRSGDTRSLALISRFPIIANNSQPDVTIQLRTGKQGRMLRGILDATVQVTDGRKFRFIGLHLKSQLDSAKERSADDQRQGESTAVRAYLNAIFAKQVGMPMLVYGDLNDTLSSPPLNTLIGVGDAPYKLSRLRPKDSRGEEWTLYYAKNVTYSAFDHLLVNDVLKKRLGSKYKAGIVDDDTAKAASDHRPLWIELR